MSIELNDEQWIEVFKTGEHTDASGDTRNWTADDLQKIVDLYNNQPENEKHEAPIVIGHPADNSPSYGWVEKLMTDGKTLFAKLKDISAEFAEWVKKGLYKKRSISLYSNLLLRHIGFLGAVPPAVKGLSDEPAFNETGNEIFFDFEDKPEILKYSLKTINAEENDVDRLINIKLQERAQKYRIGTKEGGHIVKPQYYKDLTDDDFADPTNYKLPISSNFIRATIANWGRPAVRLKYDEEEQKIIENRIKNKNQNIFLNGGKIFMEEEKFNLLLSNLIAFLLENFGEEVANQVNAFLTDNKDKYVQAIAQATPETGQGENTNASEKQQSYKDQKVQSLEIEIEKLKKENRLKDFQQYVNKLIEKEGKLLPRQYDYAVSLLELGANAGNVEFAENKAMDGLSLVKSFLESLENKVDISSINQTKTKITNNYSEFSEDEIDKERLNLDNQIREFIKNQQSEGKQISYSEALNVISKINKE